MGLYHHPGEHGGGSAGSREDLRGTRVTRRLAEISDKRQREIAERAL